jgi:pimeloyl-ACP methyl ester carboxylesterase
MAKTLILFLSLCFVQLVVYGQSLEKVIVYNHNPYGLYGIADKDSNNFFYQKLVPKNKPIGVLVILPGGGDNIEDVMKQISLHKLAVEKDILVVFPSIYWSTVKCYPEIMFLDTIFRQIVEQYKVPKNKFILGGLSGGGMLSLVYAENANMNVDSTFIKPAAVFGIDPPVDYANLYNRYKRDIERNFSAPAIWEGKMIINDFNKAFGGSPEEFPENYVKYSIYSHSQKNGGNAQYLKNTPIRLYTEPGIIWQLEKRHRDLYDINCTDITAMINLLQLQGNTEAELIVTNDKGVRLNGEKHPHSWSIMDSEGCLVWILKQLNK